MTASFPRFSLYRLSLGRFRILDDDQKWVHFLWIYIYTLERKSIQCKYLVTQHVCPCAKPCRRYQRYQLTDSSASLHQTNMSIPLRSSLSYLWIPIEAIECFYWYITFDVNLNFALWKFYVHVWMVARKTLSVHNNWTTDETHFCIWCSFLVFKVMNKSN